MSLCGREDMPARPRDVAAGAPADRRCANTPKALYVGYRGPPLSRVPKPPSPRRRKCHGPDNWGARQNRRAGGMDKQQLARVVLGALTGKQVCPCHAHTTRTFERGDTLGPCVAFRFGDLAGNTCGMDHSFEPFKGPPGSDQACQ